VLWEKKAELASVSKLMKHVYARLRPSSRLNIYRPLSPSTLTISNKAPVLLWGTHKC